LGLGVSTEYGAGDAAGALDPIALHDAHPRFAAFLEVGVETARGLDRHARAWIGRGLPTTYHYLDVNLDEPEDFDDAWLDDVRALADDLRPAWLCGDAGMWHLGRRERGHMLLCAPSSPPTRPTTSPTASSACATRSDSTCCRRTRPARSIWASCTCSTSSAASPSAPTPGCCSTCAHLAMFQRLRGPRSADRVRRLSVRARRRAARRRRQRADDRATTLDRGRPHAGSLADTWTIVEHVVPRAPNLKAVVFECERNAMDVCLPGFARLAALLDA
jgi:hypothetical protein